MYTTTSRLHRLAISAAILLNMGAVAVAQQFKANSIVIEQPWMRATPAGAEIAGGYMSITNTGSEPDRLIGGMLPQAGRFAVHEMKMNGNVMQMRELQEGLEILPGQKVELNPSGSHVMFTKLRESLKQGDTLKGRLRFEKAGLVDIEYRVEGVGAQSPDQRNAEGSHQHGAESPHQHSAESSHQHGAEGSHEHSAESSHEHSH